MTIANCTLFLGCRVPDEGPNQIPINLKEIALDSNFKRMFRLRKTLQLQ